MKAAEDAKAADREFHEQHAIAEWAVAAVLFVGVIAAIRRLSSN